ncbi:MAG: hypothetical protein E6J20_18075 [Chloroflexi bacterium]|nr:MAG: hypothetical protein E6J20_18075 [Chloroflexota bacterium]
MARAVTDLPAPAIVADQPRRRARIDAALGVEVALAAALLATLLVYLLAARFTRFVADDFSAGLAIRQNGFWAEQAADYRGWSGRFASTAAITAVVELGEVTVRVVPVLLLIAWTAASTAALRYLLPEVRRLGHLILATAIVCTCVRVTPTPFLSVYWLTGALSYTAPLVLASTVGGFAETYDLLQATALTFAAVAAALGVTPAWRRVLPPLAAAWAGGIAALAIVVAAPGNAVRDAALARIVGDRPSWLGLPRFTVGQDKRFLGDLFGSHWSSLVAMGLIAALVASRSTTLWSDPFKRAGLATAAIVALGSLALTVTVAPAAHEEAGLPPVWGQLILVYVCVVTVDAFGWVAGQCLRTAVLSVRRGAPAPWRRWVGPVAAAGAGFAALATVLGGVVSVIRDEGAMQSYANAKDAQVAAAQAASRSGVSSATVPPLGDVEAVGFFSHPDAEELSSNPTYWINNAVAAYYGLHSIAVVTDGSAQP